MFTKRQKKRNKRPNVRYASRVTGFFRRSADRIKQTCVISAFRRLGRRARLIWIGSAVVILAAAAVLMITLSGGTTETTPQSDERTAANVQSAQPAATPTPAPTPTAVPIPAPTPTPTPDPTLKKGDENVRVQELQDRLMDLGYMDIDESTQLFGPVTKYAVELFQRQHDMQQDGIAGPDTLDLIYSEEAKKYTLLEGTKGTDVDSLQRQLIDLGYLSKSTGYYGSETVDAVKAFQERNSLDADGKTGQLTLDLIYSPNAKPSADKQQAEKRRANVQTMLEIAEQQLGDKYILGNDGPNTFDCSGLVYYCLKEAGSSRGRYNAAGYAQVDDWEKISDIDNLEKGDLIFFWHKGKTRIGHVGIYIGGGMMIDASTSNGKVVKRSCVTDYWRGMFVCGRRPW